MFDHFQQREIFHLVFLKEFTKRVKPGTYAVKGGCNLRFFFDSIRYSEDLDLDIAQIEVFRLRELAMGILASPALASTLRTYGIEKVVPPNIAAAKQTETVQRFKTHILTSAGEELFTKIEFSRRNLEAGATASPVSDALLRTYRMPPLVLPHYPANIAIRQKIGALAGRQATQARDIFDLYFLSSRVTPEALAALRNSLPAEKRAAAEGALFSLTFEHFRDTVCTYLESKDAEVYSRPEVWEDIQLKVAAIITGAV